MTIPISPRRLASDDPQDAALLAEREQHRLQRDREELAEDQLFLLALCELRGYQRVHEWLTTFAACQGEVVCPVKDRA